MNLPVFCQFDAWVIAEGQRKLEDKLVVDCCVVCGFEKEEFLENSCILSCFVQFKKHSFKPLVC